MACYLDAELDRLFKALESIENFKQRYGKVIRDAMDYVIDGERMGRTRLAKAEKKATIGKTWMIPPEAIGQLCLLTRINEDDHFFQAGLLRANLDMLTKGSNQDKKRSVSALGKKHIKWLIPSGNIPEKS